MANKKVVLAYSGGLDTSVILKWLIVKKGYDVVTFTADIGQGDDPSHVREKAASSGAVGVYIENLEKEFVRDYVFPMFRCNALYEENYLLGTAVARALIAKRQIEIAKSEGACAVSHGATGKGNDQVRFELSYYANMPEIEIIAPWREWDLNSRTKLLKFAGKHNIEISKEKEDADSLPYSMDANLLHLSIEGNDLEFPELAAKDDTYVRVKKPEDAPDVASYIEIEFETGDPVAVNGKKMEPNEILRFFNKIAGENAIGRVDMVENRFIGMKSRGIYETPGGTLLLHARRAVESITMDRGAMHLRNEIMVKYADLLYNGLWFSPEREMLQVLINKSQEFVTGVVKLKLYKGNISIESRNSAYSLYRQDLATFEEDDKYTQKDAEGFIKLNALRLRILNERKSKLDK